MNVPYNGRFHYFGINENWVVYSIDDMRRIIVMIKTILLALAGIAVLLSIIVIIRNVSK